MKIIRAKYILVCNERFDILQNGAICFDEKIKDIGTFEYISEKYKNIEIINYQDSLLMPSLINLHIHLEYSANKTSLNYGNFVNWLGSIIKKRDTLIDENLNFHMQNAIDILSSSGVGAFGEISSYGLDLQICSKAKQKVVFFNEVLGSKANMIDALYNDFLDRFERSTQFKSSKFTPAISVHSPYATHYFLAKKALIKAKEENLLVSTHFMESKQERLWLDEASGEFKDFFSTFSFNPKPINSPLAYLELFRGIKTLFTHVVHANKEEIETIKEIGYITHCPISNRLLGNDILNLKTYETFTLGTDGFSSNYSLNIWNELRVALMIHNYINLNTLSKKLIKSVTINSANALNLNSGELKIDKSADFAIFDLFGEIEDLDYLSTMLILHTNKAKALYIDGCIV